MRNLVKENAVPIPLAEPPLVLTHKDLINQIFLAAYSPLQNYPIVAATIHAIETANQTTLAALAPFIVSPVACNCSASPTALPDNDYEAFSSVACGDTNADPQASESFDRAAFQAFFANLTRVAPTSGPVWSTLHLGCTQWPVRAKWRYTGAEHGAPAPRRPAPVRPGVPAERGAGGEGAVWRRGAARAGLVWALLGERAECVHGEGCKGVPGGGDAAGGGDGVRA